MKKTFFMSLKALCVGAMALAAVSCYDDSLLLEKVDGLGEKVEGLDERLTAVEKKLNDEVAKISEKITGLEAAYKLADAGFAESVANLTTQLDALDGELDGTVAYLTEEAGKIYAAIEELKKADANLADEDAKVLAALVAVGVTNVTKNADGDVVITFVDATSVTIPTTPQEGLVTVVEVDGVKYWAVVVDGKAQSLDIPVAHPGCDCEPVYCECEPVDVKFMVDEDSYLLYSVDGGATWNETGAYVADDADHLIDFYQGETDEIDWETYEYIKEDFYTVVFGGETYYLPIYKVDNSVVALKAGKTYFSYGEAKTVDVVVSEITSMYVMSKPDGWRAKLDGKKLTVTAPAEANVTSGVAEADGEVLLHCTTSEGKCKVAVLAVATTPGFSLTVSEDGTLVITNPEVVTQTNMWGETMTDFNDAYVGLAEVAAFEADPIAYVSGIQDNYDAMWYALSNWKMNTAETDEDWNMIYTIGGAYVPGEYEVDVIETTVPQMYADWTWGEEIPATPFVVWACPMDENGMPRTGDLVYGYYYPSVKATITAVAASTSDVEVSVSVIGTENYYVGLVAEEQLYGFPIDEYMQMQEGPFGYFQMALQYGMADYAFQQMGTQFGGEFGEQMPETITASMLNYGQPLMPNTKFYMWVFPVIDGVELADYTYEKNMKPYIYEFTTEGLSAGGSATVEFGEESLSFSAMNVEVASEGATMIYYNWFDADTYNAFADDAAITEALLNEGYVIGEEMGTAVNQNDVTPGAEFFLVALAVDAEGKYGEVNSKLYAAPELTFSETFKASFGESKSEVYYSGYRYDFPINVEGGEAAKYYYVFSTTEYSDEDLANLPLSYEYDYNFRSTTNVAAGQLAGQYADASSTYYLAVVVESTTGELSPVIKMTVEVPAVPETEEE